MSISDWRTISNRCKTGHHQEVASNTNVSCNGGDVLQGLIIGSPRFSIYMYCGSVKTYTSGSIPGSPFQDYNIPLTVPITSESGAMWADFYVMDNFLEIGTKQLNSNDNKYPKTYDMTGHVPMGRTVQSNASRTMDCQGPYGSIDISFGIVPSHSHGTSNADGSAKFVPNADALNDNLDRNIKNFNIEHYHPLPAIYMEMNHVNATNSSNEQNNNEVWKAGEDNDGAVDGVPRQLMLVKNDGHGTGIVSWATNKGYVATYAMGDTVNAVQNTDNGYPMDGSSNAPVIWPPKSANDDDAINNDTTYNIGMTGPNWNYKDTKWDPTNQAIINTEIDGITFKDGEEGWLTTDSSAIIIDICGTNVQQTEEGEFTNLANANEMLDSDGNLIQFPPADDPLSSQTNLGYKTVGVYFIIYYPNLDA